MKGISLFLFAVLAIAYASEATFTAYMKGYITGLSEHGSVNELSKCIKDGDAIIAKFKVALENIYTLDDAKLKAGLPILAEATRDSLSMVKACSSSFSLFAKVETGIARANIAALIRKILSSPGSYFHLAINGLEALSKGNFEGLGVAVGSIEVGLYLKSRMEGTSTAFFEFLNGFLEAINESGDINKLLECIKDGETVMNKIMEAFEYIMKMDMENMMKGVQLLIAAVTEMATKFQPCSEGFEQLKKLFSAVLNVDFMKLIAKIMAKSSQLIHDVLDCVDMFKNGYYKNAGHDLGDILFVLFLSK